MSSSWGKFLGPITVPTGGWDWCLEDGSTTVTIPAGTYASILELCDELQTQIDGAAGIIDVTVAVSSVGKVTITYTDPIA